jgi:hypothetical protein
MASLPDFAKATPLPEPPIGWYDYWYAVAHDGALVLVRVDRVFAGMNPREHHLAWSETRLRLSVVSGGVEDGIVEAAASRWPQVDRPSEGYWLVVAARAEPGDRNARLIDGEGREALAFEVGDNVASLISTSSGAIWVGYGDEATGGPPPAGFGIASFDLHRGECRWMFDNEYYRVLDCYALSASGDDVWACTYDEFPIIRIRDGQIRFWENDLRGADAIAAEGDYVILAGGYPAMRGIDEDATDDRIALLRLDDRRARVIAEVRVPEIIKHDAFMCGRDGVLHIVVGRQWFRLSVKDWVSAIG